MFGNITVESAADRNKKDRAQQYKTWETKLLMKQMIAKIIAEIK